MSKLTELVLNKKLRGKGIEQSLREVDEFTEIVRGYYKQTQPPPEGF